MEKDAQLYNYHGQKKRKKRTDSLILVRIPVSFTIKDLLTKKAVAQHTTISKLVMSLLYGALNHYVASSIRMPHLSDDLNYDIDDPIIGARIPQDLVDRIGSVRVAQSYNCSLRKACFMLLIYEMQHLGWIR
jgi:hypothetical protein